jgi:hypothetical protein
VRASDAARTALSRPAESSTAVRTRASVIV